MPKSEKGTAKRSNGDVRNDRLLKRLNRERLENELLGQIQAAGLPEPIRQHRFHPERRWRFDFAWPLCYNMSIWKRD